MTATTPMPDAGDPLLSEFYFEHPEQVIAELR